MTELPFEADERLTQIYQRAVSAGLPCAWHTLGLRPPMLKMRLPDGHSGIVIDVKPESADAFARIPFEDLVLLSEYLGYWNKRQHEVAAGIRVRYGNRRDLWALPGAEPLSDTDEKTSSIPPVNGRLSLRSNTSGLRVTLKAPPSADLFLGQDSGSVYVSIHIEGAELVDVQEAERLLFDIANAIFFDLDVNHSIALQLTERAMLTLPRAQDHPRRPEDSLHFPDRRFTRDAIALYMHARTINGYPLLEYLTFYQVIEHCMMAFSQPEMIQRLRERLVDPSFDLDDDVNLSQLLASLRRGGRTQISEREQIRLTIRACVEVEAIESFLRDDSELAQFVSSPNWPLGAHPIGLEGGRAHLVDQVADRIYDLRCRIVHAKGELLDDVRRPLMPTSSEVAQIGHDLGLIRFLAQQVLTAASTAATW